MAAPALPPLPAAKYFIHELFFEDAAHPVVRVMHPSSRQPPPHATIFRWNGIAWDELPASPLAWPVPVVGPGGQLYAYDQESPGSPAYAWDQNEWSVLPAPPGSPSFFLRAATIDRATGELVVLVSDGLRIHVERLEGDGWNRIGPELPVHNPLNPYLRVASIVADGEAVHLAYADGGVVTASLRPDGWSSSRPPDSGFVSDPVISLGAAGRLLLFATGESGADCHLAVSDGTDWRILPNAADGLELFYGATIRDDGAPLAFFQRGFPGNGEMDLAVAVWTDAGWSVSDTVPAATWGASAFFADGTGVTSAENGGSIFFVPVREP